jgi:hypothetical protein
MLAFRPSRFQGQGGFLGKSHAWNLVERHHGQQPLYSGSFVAIKLPETPGLGPTGFLDMPTVFVEKILSPSQTTRGTPPYREILRKLQSLDTVAYGFREVVGTISSLPTSTSSSSSSTQILSAETSLQSRQKMAMELIQQILLLRTVKDNRPMYPERQAAVK